MGYRPNYTPKTSKTAEVFWEYKGSDYIVTCSVSPGDSKVTTGPAEHWHPGSEPELEVTNIEVDGEGGPITDEMYALAQEDDGVYELALKSVSQEPDEPSGRDE